MNRLRSYTQMEPYLTEKAKQLIEDLQKLGVKDLDLAHQMAEDMLGESTYSIEDDDDESGLGEN